MIIIHREAGHLYCTHGQVALVDIDDLLHLQQYSWSVTKDGYPRAWIEKKRVRLGRFILQPPAGMVTDHINGDRLDNRRINLRAATIGQNNSNSRPRGTHGFKGVTEDKKANSKRWRAQICIDGRTHELGRFHTIEEAAKAYDVAARQVHGEFVRLNFREQSTR